MEYIKPKLSLYYQRIGEPYNYRLHIVIEKIIDREFPSTKEGFKDCEKYLDMIEKTNDSLLNYLNEKDVFEKNGHKYGLFNIVKKYKRFSKD